MKQAYKQISDIVAQDEVPDLRTSTFKLTLHLCKLMEETGEVAKEVNKLNGRKKWKDGETFASIKTNLKEEVADSIQCLMAIAIDAGVEYEDLVKAIKDKNKAYLDYLIKHER